MMRNDQNDFLSFIYKPLCILIVLAGLFGLVWLRASVVAISYDIRNLEETKTESLKEMKTLLANRSKVISVASIGSSLQAPGIGDHRNVSSGYVFPDRVKVIHIKRHTGPETYKASLAIEK